DERRRQTAGDGEPAQHEEHLHAEVSVLQTDGEPPRQACVEERNALLEVVERDAHRRDPAQAVEWEKPLHVEGVHCGSAGAGLASERVPNRSQAVNASSPTIASGATTQPKWSA